MTFNSLGQRLAPWALQVALLAAWQGAVVFGLLSTRILPGPALCLRPAGTCSAAASSGHI